METISISQLRPALRVRSKAFVDFMAPSCVPCRAVPGVLRQLQSYRYVPVFVVNVEEDTQVVSDAFAVRSLPTVVLYEHGRELARVEGAIDIRGAISRFGPILGLL